MNDYRLGPVRFTFAYPMSWEAELVTPKGSITILLTGEYIEVYDKAAYALERLKETGELPTNWEFN